MSHKKWLHAFVVFECPLGKTFREIALRVFVYTIYYYLSNCVHGSTPETRFSEVLDRINK